MNKICFFFSLLLTLSLSAYAETQDVLKVTSYTLDNGLTVWLNEDHTAPTAFGAVVVKAGARDCPGTGIAHYFEHIMFKGTDRFGTINYAAEKPYLDSIAVLYDSLAVTKDNGRRERIQMEINRLNIAGSRYVIPNEFDALTTLCGGTNLNAFTNQDCTVYHNYFIPQYLEQWAQLNSDRLIKPVFRLFQSELETVYEEKNMYADDLFTSIFEKLEEYAFNGTPYAMPIIGTTENLKNPRLSQMADFYNKYYVAGNMGLLISGDFDTETVKPVIERTFGRIRPGGPVKREAIIQQEFHGRTEQDIVMDIPVIQPEAIFYKAPASMQEDYLECELLSHLLSNSDDTGLMDKLQNEHKLMHGGVLYNSYHKAGGFLIYFISKPVIQSTANAEKMVMSIIGQLKSGDFDDELLQSCKLAYLREISEELEDISDRSRLMMESFLTGLNWEDYLEKIKGIKSITKEDIVRVANKYLTNDCMVIRKKKGKPEKDKLRKPPYEHVTPENKDSTSLYARRFAQSAEAVDRKMPEFDFDANVTQTQIVPLVKLYSARNPVNDIFYLKLKFRRGTIAEPALDRLASYMNKLGTYDKSHDELCRELQAIGGSIQFSASANDYTFTISGYDESFEKTFALAATMLKDVKEDKDKFKAVIEDEKTEVKLVKKNLHNLAICLFDKAALGDNSPYLIDKGKADDNYLLGLWKELQKVQCDILYSGNLDPAQVSETIRKHIDVDAVAIPSEEPVEYNWLHYQSSEVKFIDKPDASQTLIYAYIPTDILPDLESRTKYQFLDEYLGGGGMTSIMFQEIREFRSMAYATYSGHFIPEWKNRNQKAGFLQVVVGTQCDKALDAMHVMDSLLTDLPIRSQKFKEKKTEFYNELHDSYPGFRSQPVRVENGFQNGLNRERKQEKLDVISSLMEDEFASFAKEYLSGRPVVWCVVGSSKKMDMKALESFGPVEILKPSDVIR